jgi:hypothetical protein
MANATIIATTKESGFTQNVTFDVPQAEADINLPTVWNETHPGALLVNGLRLSSSLITGIIWAANVTGKFNFTQLVSILLNLELG